MGKQHGTLAKAGKVRKATPKKDKKEITCKDIRGRARLLRKYKKRFFYLKEIKQKGMNPQAAK